jgi:hypothetical protein
MFWTGSKDPLSPANASGAENCANWTDTTQKATSGSSDRSNHWYAEFLGDLCQFPHRVLCLQK